MGSRDHLFKVLVVGDAAVGKTSLVQRYSQDSFSKHYKSTVGGKPSRGAGRGGPGPGPRTPAAASRGVAAGDLVSLGPSSGQEVGVWDPRGNNCWVFALHACWGFPSQVFLT